MTTPVFVGGAHGEGITPSFALNAGSNAGRTVVVLTTVNPSSSEHVTGVTYGGNAMTEFPSSPFTDNFNTWHIQGFYLKNAPSGSNNVSISQAVGGNNVYAVALAYDTCDTSAPVTNDIVFQSNNGSLNSGTVTSASGNLAVVIGAAYASAHDPDTHSVGTGVTKDYSEVDAIAHFAGFGLRKAGSSSVTLTDTITCSDAQAVAVNYGFAFNLVGSGGGGGATAVTFGAHPSSGAVNAASTNISIGVEATPITGTLVVTPASNKAGTFSPTTVSLTTGSPSATVTFTPTVSGVHTISSTNNGSLTNPATFTYTVAPEVTFTLVASPTDATTQNNLTSMHWMSFDQTDPASCVAPTDKGSAETSDGSGVMTIPLSNSTKTNGQNVLVVGLNAAGTSVFAGIVAVT